MGAWFEVSDHRVEGVGEGGQFVRALDVDVRGKGPRGDAMCSIEAGDGGVDELADEEGDDEAAGEDEQEGGPEQAPARAWAMALSKGAMLIWTSRTPRTA